MQTHLKKMITYELDIEAGKLGNDDDENDFESSGANSSENSASCSLKNNFEDSGFAAIEQRSRRCSTADAALSPDLFIFDFNFRRAHKSIWLETN